MINLFRNKQKKDALSSGAVEYMIVGLGNPGRQYEQTRHNIGFMAIDKLAEKAGCKINRLKYKSLMGFGEINGHRVLLLKPQTFMNNSGQAVTEAMSFYKLPPERVIVLLDDISLEPGALRIRRKGSDGGQKGMRSIIYLSGQDRFPRVKIGVGAKPNPQWELADWVLSRFSAQEFDLIDESTSNACSAVEHIVSGDIDNAMNLYNSYSK